MSEEFNAIVTHFDLDGVASAALCTLLHDIDRVSFAGPANLDRLSYDEKTLVTDLPHPYPKECGFWFDHHMANLSDLAYLTDPASIPSVIEEKPSCLRVIYDHYSKEYELDEWASFVDEVDLIDGFLFKDFAHWNEVTDAKNIDHAIKYDWNDFQFLRKLVFQLRDFDFTEVAQDEEVLRRAEKFRKKEQDQLPIIEKVARPLDDSGDLILLDLTGLRNPPRLEKNLAYNFFPDAKAVVTVRAIFQRGQKTNGLSFSMSLGFVGETLKKQIDFGAMMRELEIGSGHPGAAAGRFDCKSKDERLKRQDEVLNTIITMWNNQQKS